MDANLVFTPGVEFQFDEAVTLRATQGAVVGDGFPPSVVEGAGIGDEHAVVGEPTLHGALVFFHLSLANGDVAAVGDDFLPVLHEDLLDVAAFGKKEEARGFAVEAVNSVDGKGPVLALHVFVENVLHGLSPAARQRIGEDAVGFFHDNEEGVFIDEFHPAAIQGMFVPLVANLHQHAGAQGCVELCGDFLVNINHALRQQLLDSSA